MKKMLILLGSTLGALLILLVILVGVSSSGGDGNLTAGTYVYGEDMLFRKGSMYQLEGPGEIIINSSEGEEVYYKELKEGESVHEHSLPLDEESTLTITEEAEAEVI